MKMPADGADAALADPGTAAAEAAGQDVAPLGAELRAALRELIDDPRFAASERNRRFLAYVVEEELQGRGPHIRAYNVAVDVFRRPPDFDANLDPIVRIEAGRLRQALARYYEEVAPAATWRIVIPKGAYRPRFERAAPAGTLAGRLRPQPVAAGLLALAVAATLWLALTERWPGPAPPATAAPAILVVPFAVLEGGADAARLARGLTGDVVDRLARFRSFEIFGPPVYRHALDEGSIDLARVAEHVHADYLVEGTLRQTPDRITVTVQLKEQATGRYLWTYRADNRLDAAQDVFASLFDIAGQIASTLGQPLGIVNRAEWLERQPRSLSAYQCVLQAHDYYRSIDAAGHAAARDCLEAAVAADPSYAAAWVMLAWVYLDEARYRLNPRPELYDAETRAREAVERALALDPEQEMALDALSVLQFRAGDMAAFRRTGERMLALNPNDPDLAADFGGRLAFSGDWKRGMPLVRRAMALAIKPPGTYHMALAWDHYRRGDYPAALLEADRIQMPEFQMGLLTRAAIYGQLGMQPEAAAAMAQLRRLRPDLAANPRPWLLGLHFEPAFADRLAEGVTKAGGLAAPP
ncbi:MAG: hypothetical protein AB7I59_00910 [Geminicoccaceae bacterium]